MGWDYLIVGIVQMFVDPAGLQVLAITFQPLHAFTTNKLKKT